MQANNSKLMKAEGDINLSAFRKEFQQNNLSKKTKEKIEEDQKYFLHQALSSPCLDSVERVEGIYIYSSDGKKYIDFHGNSVHQLGYNHPTLVAAMQKQLTELTFSPRRFCNDSATKLAKKLVELNGGNKKVLFTTGGTSSIGVALKLVRKVKGKYKTISMWDSFHGASLDAISVGGEAHFRKGIGPLLPGCEHIMPFNSYRPVLGEGLEANMKALDYLEYMCECQDDVGALIMEPIRCTDVQIPPKEYYKRIRDICDKYDIALIFDEVPVAFGRTGKMFAYQNYDIEPDILVIGKGMGGSLVPMSAVIVKDEYNVCQDISLGHYTHEKNPIGSAVALSMIEFIEENKILERVKVIEQILVSKANAMMGVYSLIGDVRCIGAMLAIELVENRDTKEKAYDKAEAILYDCLENGLSFKISQGNVLTLSPPLIITDEELYTALSIVENAIKKQIK